MSRPKSHPPQEPSSDWLTTTEVAALLRVHPKHVYRLLHQGMPARRVGGQWRFSRDAIATWADQRQVTDNSPTTLGPPLLAIPFNEVAEAVIEALTIDSDLRLATMTLDAKSCLEALESGEVVATILCEGDKKKTVCPTLRISLGTRALGLISPQPRKRTELDSVAVPALLNALKTRLELPNQACLKTQTESDACMALVRNQVTAALGSEAWAKRLGYSFEALASEPWELAIRVDAMEEPGVSRLCIAAQSDQMAKHLAFVLPDYPRQGGQMRLAGGVKRDLPIPAKTPPEPVRRSSRTQHIRWTILARDGSEQMLELVQALRNRGVRVGGFVQVPSGPATSKPLGYDLYRLSQPERVPFAERIRKQHSHPSNQRHCELTFHSDVLARACEWLREDVAVSDVLIVDGVGRLEERGQGLFPALAWARTQPYPTSIILSSRWEHVPEVAARLELGKHHVTELAFGQEETTPPHVIDHILRSCGKTKTKASKRMKD